MITHYLPLRVVPYRSRSSGTSAHHHQSLIVNITCGAVVENTESLHGLFEGSVIDSIQPFMLRSSPTSHCADAVISFVSKVVLASKVSTPLTEVVKHWVQTRLDFDMIFAQVVHSDWARQYQLVLSQKGKHHVYTGYHIVEPDGKLVVCHRNCGAENRTWKINRQDVMVTCNKCSSMCSIPLLHLNPSSLLGSRGLVKATYPRKCADTVWRLTEVTEGTTAQKKACKRTGTQCMVHEMDSLSVSQQCLHPSTPHTLHTSTSLPQILSSHLEAMTMR